MNLEDVHPGMPISIKWEMHPWSHPVSGQSGIVDKIIPDKVAPISIVFQNGQTFPASLSLVKPYERRSHDR